MIKRFTLFILAVYPITHSPAQDHSRLIINEQFIDKTLYSIFARLDLKYDLQFDFKEEDVPNDLISRGFFTNTSLKEVLSTLLSPYEVDFVINSNLRWTFLI